MEGGDFAFASYCLPVNVGVSSKNLWSIDRNSSVVKTDLGEVGARESARQSSRTTGHHAQRTVYSDRSSLLHRKPVLDFRYRSSKSSPLKFPISLDVCKSALLEVPPDKEQEVHDLLSTDGGLMRARRILLLADYADQMARQKTAAWVLRGCSAELEIIETAHTPNRREAAGPTRMQTVLSYQ